MKTTAVNIDLSTRKNSMTSVIKDNSDTILSVTTVPGMALMLTKLFAQHGINTKASNRLITNVRAARTIVEAQTTVYNSFLAGTGNSVIR
jgi:hypothetical protein